MVVNFYPEFGIRITRGALKLVLWVFAKNLSLTRSLIDGFLQVWIPYGHVNAHSAMTDVDSVISNAKSEFIEQSSKKD